MTSKEIAYKSSELILEKKGKDIVILDLTNITSVTDYFVICSASSDVQVKAISDYVVKEMSRLKEKPWHSEGYNKFNWVLLDFVDVVVHIFLEDVRKFYNLESLWADAEITRIDENYFNKTLAKKEKIVTKK